MPVFRVEKTSNYTVMSNHHLQNRDLSLKAKGLLSLMLSLPEGWDYTLNGLTVILHKDGIDSVRTAMRELEKNGYLVRRRIRNDKGHLTTTEYIIYENPQRNLDDQPIEEKPILENPMLDNPIQEKPILDNPIQLITNELNKQEVNKNVLTTNLSIYPKEIVKDNIDCNLLISKYGKERVNEIIDLIYEVVNVQYEYLKIGDRCYPIEVVKDRLLGLDHTHIEYVFDMLDNNTTKIRNIKAYIISSLFNAKATITNFYNNQVNYDFNRNS